MDEENIIDFGGMSLEKFQTWSNTALRRYLFVRNKNSSGTFHELAARAFIAWEQNIEVDITKEKLERQNLQEYKWKLTINNKVTIQDPYTIKTGWLGESAMEFWPSLYFQDICEYLRLTTPRELYFRLINEYKQGKGYRYYSSGWIKEVLYHNIDDHTDVCLFSTTCTPSMNVRQPPYEIWAIIEKDSSRKPGGKIYSAHCTCTAGLHGSCNHIVGMLFRIEAAVAEGLTNPSSTSKLCKWNVPGRFEPQHPIRLEAEKWSKSTYFETKNENYFESTSDRSQNYGSVSADEAQNDPSTIRNELGDALRDIIPNSCFIQMLDSTPMPEAPAIVCPKPLLDTAIELSVGGETDIEVLLTESSLTTEQIDTINEATVLQSSSKDWHAQRKGRITASNFARVDSKMKNMGRRSDTDSLVKAIVGLQDTPQVTAMKHGNALEPKAKVAYRKVMKPQHKGFSMKESGLVICEGTPYLGATPDLVVSCKCHGTGLCEIKCPYSIKHQAPSAQNYSSHLCTDEDGNVQLSTKSGYYCQIQGQLGVTKLPYCDIFIYTAYGYHLQRISFDSQYWADLLNNLTGFWLTYVGPSLLNGQFNLRDVVPAHVSTTLDHSYFNSSNTADASAVAVKVAHATARSVLSKPKYDIQEVCSSCGADVVGMCSCCD